MLRLSSPAKVSFTLYFPIRDTPCSRRFPADQAGRPVPVQAHNFRPSASKYLQCIRCLMIFYLINYLPYYFFDSFVCRITRFPAAFAYGHGGHPPTFPSPEVLFDFDPVFTDIDRLSVFFLQAAPSAPFTHRNGPFPLPGTARTLIYLDLSIAGKGPFSRMSEGRKNAISVTDSRAFGILLFPFNSLAFFEGCTFGHISVLRCLYKE